jgi:hypothetical protein
LEQLLLELLHLLLLQGDLLLLLFQQHLVLSLLLLLAVVLVECGSLPINGDVQLIFSRVGSSCLLQDGLLCTKALAEFSQPCAKPLVLPFVPRWQLGGNVLQQRLLCGLYCLMGGVCEGVGEGVGVAAQDSGGGGGGLKRGSTLFKHIELCKHSDVPSLCFLLLPPQRCCSKDQDLSTYSVGGRLQLKPSIGMLFHGEPPASAEGMGGGT